MADKSQAPEHSKATDPKATDPKATDPKTAARPSWPRRVISAMFGFDFFICYAHADGKTYARALNRSLAKDYECFFDEQEFAPGDSLPLEDRLALMNTSCLLVIITPGALKSHWVKWEIKTFKERKRRIMPICIGDIDGVEMESKNVLGIDFEDILWVGEAKATGSKGPSGDAVEKIRLGFNKTRQRIKRIRVASALAAVFLVISGIAAWQSQVAQRETARALKLLSANQEQLRVERGIRAITLADQPRRAAQAFEAALGSVESLGGAVRAPNEGYLGLSSALEAVRRGLVLNDQGQLFYRGRFSNKGRWLALLRGAPNELHLFHARSGRRQNAFRLDYDVRQIEFSPDDRHLVVLGSESNELVVYGLDGVEQQRLQVEQHGALRAFDFIGQGRFLVVWGEGPPVSQNRFDLTMPTRWGPYVFDWQTHERVHTFHHLVGLVASKSGRMLWITDARGSRALVDFEPGRLLHHQKHPLEIVRSFPAPSPGDLTGVDQVSGVSLTAAFSPDSRELVFSGSRGAISVIDAHNGQDRWTETPLHKSVTALSWSPDGSKIAVGCHGGELALLDSATGEVIFKSEEVPGPMGSGAPWVHELSWSPDSRKLFVHWPGHAAGFFDVTTGHPHWMAEDLPAAEHAPDHGRFLSIDEGRVARLHFSERLPTWLWAAGTVENGQYRDLLAAASMGTSRVESLFHSESGLRVLYIDERKTLHLFDPADGKGFFFEYGALACLGARLSRDGRRLFCGDIEGELYGFEGGGRAPTWRVEIPQPEGLEEKKGQWLDAQIAGTQESLSFEYEETLETYVTATALTATGELMVGTSRGELHRIDPTNGSVLETIRPGDERIFDISVVDQDRIAIAGASGQAFLIDLSTGSYQALAGHDRNVHAIAAARGPAIITGAQDGIVRLFDGFGRTTGRFNAHSGAIYRLAVSTDGQRVAILGEVDQLRIFDLASGDLLQRHTLQHTREALLWHEDRILVAGYRKIFAYKPDLEDLIEQARQWHGELSEPAEELVSGP